MDKTVKLSENKEPYVRIDVAKNKNCPVEVLAKLAADNEPEVRYAVAKNANCPAETLIKLAGDKYLLIRCAVAENPNCPAELLAKLTRSKVVNIRVAVADNPACPEKLMEKLARDESCNVRYAVADNPNCTNELMRIAFDGNHGTPEAIRSIQLLKLPKKLEPLRKRIEPTVKPFIAMKELGDTLPDEFILGSLRERTFSKKLRLWQSKIGGFPYFQKSHEYPTDPNGQSLLLLLQINFEDVPKLSLFPEKGILQIYLGNADEFPYGMNLDDPFDQTYFRVLFFPEVIYDKDALITDFEFLPKDNSYMPCTSAAPIKFDLKHEPISADDYRFSETIFGSNEDEDEVQVEISEIYREQFCGGGSKIGGYPDSGEDSRNYYQCSPVIKLHRGGWKQEADEYEFILLMQFDGGFDMMWGDCGYAEFFIRKADLLKRDFSKVLYRWVCT